MSLVAAILATSNGANSLKSSGLLAVLLPLITVPTHDARYIKVIILSL